MSTSEKAAWAVSLLVGIPGAVLWFTTDDHNRPLCVLTFTLPVIVLGVLSLMTLDRLVQPRLPIEPPIELPIELPVDADATEPGR